MKITSLLENTCENEKFQTEHGLSLYIEANGKKILFDMGKSDLFAKNASEMNVNLADVDFAILSHGHYDHGGGMETFLEINKTAPIYINTYAFESHYNGTAKFIGLDEKLANSNRLVFVDESLEIAEGFELFSCNDKKRAYETNPFGLTIFENDNFVPEDFRHEQYFLIKENGKRVLFSGCSHKGILNIMQWFTPDVLIGGFHFKDLNPTTTDKEQLVSAAKILNSYDTKYFTCHCTGVEQYNFLKDIMKDKLEYISTGKIIEI